MQPSANAISVRRPQRWDEPFDPSMADSEVAWLLTRTPFAQMSPQTFPPNTPLEGILRNDCCIRRYLPGEVVVREGDYGNSAFLVLSGSVRALLKNLRPEQLGRTPPQVMGWKQALRQLWRRPAFAETREPHAINTSLFPRVAQVDDRQGIFLQDFDGVLNNHKTLELTVGDLFGEVAAMFRSPRTATVIADCESTLLEIRWQGLRLLRRDKPFTAQLEQHFRANWLKKHLQETPQLRYLPAENLQRVADAVVMQSYGRIEWNAQFQKTRKLPAAEQIESEPLVASEAHLPTDLILIRAGFARLCQQHGAGHQTSAYLGKGQLFGLEEIAHNAFRPAGTPPLPLQQSLRAVGFLDTLHIPLETVAEHVLPFIRKAELPRPITRIRRSGNEAVDRSLAAPSGAQACSPTGRPDGEAELPTGLLEFIVQNRLNNGRQAMVVDLHRCTRCDDCVKACASTHDGNPRFARIGSTHQRLQFVQACMHCLDPVCMIGCPTGAIARNPTTGTVSVHEPICVGCGTCAAACPYQNIQMVEVRDPQGRFYRDEKTELPILKATKCDMCQTQPSGPACAAACPHDALVRIDLSNVDALRDWLRERGVREGDV